MVDLERGEGGVESQLDVGGPGGELEGLEGCGSHDGLQTKSAAFEGYGTRGAGTIGG